MWLRYVVGLMYEGSRATVCSAAAQTINKLYRFKRYELQ